MLPCHHFIRWYTGGPGICKHKTTYQSSLNLVVIGVITTISAIIGLLMFYITRLGGIEKFTFTGNLSNVVLLFIILAIVVYSLINEKYFKINQTNIFDSFVTGAKDGFTTEYAYCLI